jgi:hypothetical protein
MSRVEQERIFRELVHGLRAVTGHRFDFILRLIHVHVLEVEDVLFHLDSAVMMPARPEGTSSEDGTEDDATDTEDGAIQARQDVLTGIDVLAIALRQFEFDPHKRILIAGHTDTSGGIAMNFELSDQRAENVLFLLEGNREEWARVAHARHKVEDYQQILTWISVNPRWRWPCDPLGIDDTWGPDTRDATHQFVESYNSNVASPPEDAPAPGEDPPEGYKAPLPPNLHLQVNADPRHKWPENAWAAVYDLYQEELEHKLRNCGESLASLRSNRLQFVDEVNKYVGCGESFPVDDAERTNYRSQLNRRVEVLFFDAHEVPNLDEAELSCPTDRTRTHTREECPLYNGCHYSPVYIDPDDLDCIAYHVKFAYYNKILGRREFVPEGLEFQAYEDSDRAVPTRTQFSEGVYCIKVDDNPSRTVLYFEFETENKWIHTADASSDPSIVTMTPDQINALPPQDRHKYYDLPAKWSSRNYWTRGDGAAFTPGNRFEEVMDTERDLKPYGPNSTTYEQPLVFSLDDIVLLDTAGGTQAIQDADHQANPQNLSDRSRVKLMVASSVTGFLRLHRTGAALNSARIPFPSNLITVDATDVKIVFFRDGFYTVGNKRTQESANWASQQFVVGARAAVRDDADHHVTWGMQHNHTEFGSTGDFDLHYFHNLHFDDQHPVSYSISYASMNFMADTRNPTDWSPIPTAAQVQNFIDEGSYRAMSVWNLKRSYMEERNPTDTTFIIRHFVFFDEREHFSPTTPAGGWVNCNFENWPSQNATDNFETLFGHANVQAAERNALGGRPKFLGMVCRNKPGSGDWGPAWHRACRGTSANAHYSLLKLNRSAYRQANTYGGWAVTEHGLQWRPHTMAHELGHGTGYPDEYVRRKFKAHSASNARSYANFKQHHVPYSIETTRPSIGSMMQQNRIPRLRNLWYALHMLNSQSNTAGSDLNGLLPNRDLVGRLRRGTWDLTYSRRMTGGNPSVPANWESPVHSSPNHVITSDPQRRVSLSLYDVGQDESSSRFFHTAQGAMQYQGVLVVRVLMNISWGGTWTNTQKETRIQGIDQAYRDWSGHFRLTGGTGDIQNIYVHFVHGFYSSDDHDTEGDKHYDIELTRGTETTIDTGFFDSSDLEVSRMISAADLVNYFFNRRTGQTSTQALSFLKPWVDSRLPGSFTLQSFGSPP